MPRPGRRRAPCAGRAWRRSRNRSPRRKSKRSSTSCCASEASMPARGIVGGKPEPQAPPPSSSTSVSRAPAISTECAAPPSQKMRSIPAASSPAAPHVRVRGEGLRDVEEIARRQRRARRHAVGVGVMPAEPQQLAREALVAARRPQRGAAVDRHPGRPVVEDGAVLVEKHAPDRHALTPAPTMSSRALCPGSISQLAPEGSRMAGSPSTERRDLQIAFSRSRSTQGHRWRSRRRLGPRTPLRRPRLRGSTGRGWSGSCPRADWPASQRDPDLVEAGSARIIEHEPAGQAVAYA